MASRTYARTRTHPHRIACLGQRPAIRPLVRDAEAVLPAPRDDPDTASVVGSVRYLRGRSTGDATRDAFRAAMLLLRARCPVVCPLAVPLHGFSAGVSTARGARRPAAMPTTPNAIIRK